MPSDNAGASPGCVCVVLEVDWRTTPTRLGLEPAPTGGHSYGSSCTSFRGKQDCTQDSHLLATCHDECVNAVLAQPNLSILGAPHRMHHAFLSCFLLSGVQFTNKGSDKLEESALSSYEYEDGAMIASRHRFAKVRTADAAHSLQQPIAVPLVQELSCRAASELLKSSILIQ